MGIEILCGTLGGDERERAVLVDGSTGRPLALPMFEEEEEAEGFLGYAQADGVRDVRALGPRELDDLHSRWMRLSPRVREIGDWMFILTATDQNGLRFRVQVLPSGEVVDRFGHRYARDPERDDAEWLGLLDEKQDEPIRVRRASYERTASKVAPKGKS